MDELRDQILKIAAVWQNISQYDSFIARCLLDKRPDLAIWHQQASCRASLRARQHMDLLEQLK